VRRRIGCVAAACLLGAVLCLLAVAGLNHSGFCWRQGRYLSNDERILLAVQEVIRLYPPTIPRVVNGGAEIEFRRVESAIPYASVNDFLTSNPNCCDIRSTGLQGFPRGFWNSVAGRNAGYVHVRYLVRSRRDGDETRVHHEMAVAISNCGRAWSGV
jgi:hypothetical protein